MMDENLLVGIGTAILCLCFVVWREFIWKPSRKKKRGKVSNPTPEPWRVLPTDAIVQKYPRQIIVRADNGANVLFDCDLWNLIEIKRESLRCAGLDNGGEELCVFVTISGPRPSQSKGQTFSALNPDEA